MLTQEEVKKIATLSRIALSDAEVEKFQKELSSVLDYADVLKEVNTSGVMEVSQVTGLLNIKRRDEIVISEHREAILANAPEIKDEYFKVKAIL